MRRKPYLILGAALLAVALSACGPSGGEESAPASPTPPAPSTEAAPSAAAAVTIKPTAVPTTIPETATPAAVTESPAAETEPPAEESVEPIPAETPAATPAPVEPTPAPSPSPELPERPSDVEVLAAYEVADEAYSWFAMTTLPVDTNRPEPVGELIYYPVSDPRFPTMDALRAYLKTLFSDEIVDGLLPLDGVHYLDLNGALYAADAARGGDLTKGGVTYSVAWPEGEPVSCTVRAEVELLDQENLTKVVGSQIYEFPYEKVGDKWVFTHFESIF